MEQWPRALAVNGQTVQLVGYHEVCAIHLAEHTIEGAGPLRPMHPDHEVGYDGKLHRQTPVAYSRATGYRMCVLPLPTPPYGTRCCIPYGLAPPPPPRASSPPACGCAPGCTPLMFWMRGTGPLEQSHPLRLLPSGYLAVGPRAVSPLHATDQVGQCPGAHGVHMGGNVAGKRPWRASCARRRGPGRNLQLRGGTGG